MTVCVRLKNYNERKNGKGYREMGKDAEDKAERVLSIYTRLKQGRVIYKENESREYHVSARTIQRDIADIQCFLQNQNADTGEVQEIVFEKSSGGYVLQTRSTNQLESREILLIAKALLESPVLVKKELFPILHKLVRMCNDETREKLLAELLQREN